MTDFKYSSIVRVDRSLLPSLIPRLERLGYRLVSTIPVDAEFLCACKGFLFSGVDTQDVMLQARDSLQYVGAFLYCSVSVELFMGVVAIRMSESNAEGQWFYYELPSGEKTWRLCDLPLFIMYANRETLHNPGSWVRASVQDLFSREGVACGAIHL